MILAIDVGNSNTVVGGNENGKVFLSERGKTDPNAIKTLLIKVRDEMKTAGIFIDGAILSSVVPAVNEIISREVMVLFGVSTVIVHNRMKCNLTMPDSFLDTLGSDIFVGCVAAVDEYLLPAAVIDMGTATTVFLVDKNRYIRGGTIHPGIGIELQSLSANTAQLPHTNFDAPDTVIGMSSEECMRAGVLYGHAGMIDSIIAHMEEEIHQPITAIATGGLGRFVVPLCRHEVIYDDDLLIKGLDILYRLNK